MDFNFVGDAYSAESWTQDAQECINWYLEFDKRKQEEGEQRGVKALYPTPGFTLVSNAGGTAPVRAMKRMSGGKIMLAVIGANVYSYNVSMIATFVGALATTTGYVGIADNGNAAMIADGVNRYSYSLTGANSTSFTASIASNVLTVTSMIGASTIGVGQLVAGTGITIPTYIIALGTGTGGVGTYILSQSWTISSETITSTGSFSTLASSDGPFTGAYNVDVNDNYLIYNLPNSQQWGATNALSAISPQLSFASKFTGSDNLVTLISNQRVIYLLGETTCECWIDTGSFPFPYSVIPGSTTQHGCAAGASVARLADSFAFLSQDTKGQGIIVMMEGYSLKRISSHAVEYSLEGNTINDAIAWSYQIGGHEFYVITFPSIDLTWVYDATTEMWHKWLSMDANGIYHRHRGNCMANFNGNVYIGDYQNGAIYQLSNSIYTENSQAIRRLRRCPHIVEDLQRVFFEELQLQFQPGVGLTSNIYPVPSFTDIAPPAQIYWSAISGIAVSGFISGGYSGGGQVYSITQQIGPQVMLRWSDDGGFTWSNEHWRSIGASGQYKNRTMWRRMGYARDRIFEVSMIEPVKAVIVSANLKADGGGS